jgi:tetratricopeptide (TPR) repeat protein
MRSLVIDGKVDASNAGDMLTQRLLGLLPVLLHRDPQTVCIIGLGSGVTLGSALASSQVRQADVVEISPEVVEASALFSRENGDALRDPRVRLIVGDGRAHLMLTTRTYDVIVSEPSNPWMSGVAALFTREFFAAARARLNPDGLLCQWAHIYEISPSDLRSIVHTFAAVFPRATMWLVGDGDLLLIGSAGADLEAGLPRLAERSSTGSISDALADVAITPAAAAFDLLSLFAGGPAELARYGDGAAVQTDDRMALEFTAPRAVYIRSTNENSAAIRGLISEGRFPAVVAAARRSADAHSWSARGTMAMKADAYDMAYESFRHAVALNGHDVMALRGASEAAAEMHAEAAERKWLETLAQTEPANSDIRVELSHVMAAGGDFDRAVAMASAAQQLDPASARPAEQLASIYADLADAKRLEPLAAALIARFPDRDDSRYYHAASRFISGRPAEAAEEARRLLAANPGYAKAENLLGAACATMGRRECAQAAFERSIRLNPRDASAYVNLGFFFLAIDRPDAATDRLAEAIALDPLSTRAKDGLVQARAALRR